MMKLNKIVIIIELIIIFFYLFIIFHSLIIFPINIILGIICVLFLPGYNLLNLIKPRSKIIKKLGYMTILSLAIENIYMFFYYFLLYDIVTTPQKPGFVFNSIMLIIAFQIINLILILVNELKKYRKKVKNNFYLKKFEYKEHEKERNKNFDYNIINFIKEKINGKILLVYIGFIISLILMCISCVPSYVLYNQFGLIHREYRQNFTFFRGVQPVFYLFLIISILCLTYILFFTKNKYLILISFSIFMYCLWILPYIQIGNYFGEDSYFLMESYNNYLKYGIKTEEIIQISGERQVKYSTSFYIRKEIGGQSFRYSTGIFTAIILTSATGADINFTLWYLYPLIFVFSPFFFYSIFQKFSNKEGNNNLNLIILTILAMLTTQFLKCAHSATTTVLGVYIFLILVIEFFDLMHEREIKFKIINFLLIVFLYIFLCLTHFEECIYFLLLIPLYCLYFLFFELKKTRLFNVSLKKNPNRKFKGHSNYTFKIKLEHNSIFKNDYFTQKYLKRTLIMIGFLLAILLLIFYLIQEFFGNITIYYLIITEEDTNFTDDLINFYNLYENTKFIKTPFIKDSFLISFYIIRIIILGIITLTIVVYLIFFKFYRYLLWIYNNIFFFLKKMFYIVKKIISLKFLQFLIFPIFFGVILLIDWLYYPFLQEQGLLLIIELILNYTIIIFHIFLIIKGVLYYKIENDKQNYFLISIFASSSVMVFCFISGNVFVTYHLLNSKFLPIFMILNLIIIQDTYFKDFMRKKKIYLILFIIFILFLGTYYSLNKIGWE